MLNTKEMDAVILCGGLGKRLHSIVNDRPKPMAKINGYPFLDILIGYVAGFGFKRFILCVGYKASFIKQYYQRKKTSLKILFSEEEEPLGTGGAVKKAESLIRSSHFLVMNGDSLCRVDLVKFVNFHLRKKALLSILVTSTEDNGGEKKNYGQISLGGSGLVTSFNEKHNTASRNLISAGIYLFDKKALSFMPEQQNISLERDFFPRMASKKFYGYVTGNNFIDIGTPDRYKMAQQVLKRR